jgi:hypothetical protein
MRTLLIHALVLFYGALAVHLVYPLIPPEHFSPFVNLLDAWSLFLAHPSLTTVLWLAVYIFWIPVCYIFGVGAAVIFWPLHWALSQPEYQTKGGE